ncbi:MAG: hypothetical protein H0T51_25730 [Pirellulales bacterium]|nr:hypothetical protein [Pirellulales bacterium]
MQSSDRSKVDESAISPAADSNPAEAFLTLAADFGDLAGEFDDADRRRREEPLEESLWMGIPSIEDQHDQMLLRIRYRDSVRRGGQQLLDAFEQLAAAVRAMESKGSTDTDGYQEAWSTYNLLMGYHLVLDLGFVNNPAEVFANVCGCLRLGSRKAIVLPSFNPELEAEFRLIPPPDSSICRRFETSCEQFASILCSPVAPDRVKNAYALYQFGFAACQAELETPKDPTDDQVYGRLCELQMQNPTSFKQCWGALPKAETYKRYLRDYRKRFGLQKYERHLPGESRSAIRPDEM